MSSSIPQFRCSMFCSNSGQEDEAKIGFCYQEEGKKSSFLLKPDEAVTILKPAHLKVEYRVDPESDTASPFFLGGFQLVSNAKHIEVYLTDKEGKEAYLMTSKGILYETGENGEEWYKAVTVVPGGPRPITLLHVKLLSLKPKDATLAFLQSLKITARIPEIIPQVTKSPSNSPAKKASSSSSSPPKKPATPSKIPTIGSSSKATSSPPSDKTTTSGSPSANSAKPRASPTEFTATNTATNTTTTTSADTSTSTTPSSTGSSYSTERPTTPQQLFQSPPPPDVLTQKDLGAAMSSLSLMAKNAEDRIENTMSERFSKMEGFMEAKWARMEKHVFSLTSVVISQKSLLAQKVRVMNQQEEMIKTQMEQLEMLSKSQQEMAKTIETLSKDVSKLRKVLQLVVKQGEDREEKSKEYEQHQKEQEEAMNTQTGKLDVLIQHQHELQMRVQTLQVQVSEIRHGLQPIMEQDEETDADEIESAYGTDANTTFTDGDNDLMQFPESDDEMQFATGTNKNKNNNNNEIDEQSLQSAPKRSLGEHFATNGIKVVKCGSYMNDSVPETAIMSDMGESFNHLQKIEVKLLDDDGGNDDNDDDDNVSQKKPTAEETLIPSITTPKEEGKNVVQEYPSITANTTSNNEASAVIDEANNASLIDLENDKETMLLIDLNNELRGVIESKGEEPTETTIESLFDAGTKKGTTLSSPTGESMADSQQQFPALNGSISDLSVADGLSLLKELSFDFFGGPIAMMDPFQENTETKTKTTTTTQVSTDGLDKESNLSKSNDKPSGSNLLIDV